MGPLASVDAAMPTPRGEVAVAYRRDGERLRAEITLPEGLPGRFSWRGPMLPPELHAGTQVLKLP